MADRTLIAITLIVWLFVGAGTVGIFLSVQNNQTTNFYHCYFKDQTPPVSLCYPGDQKQETLYYFGSIGSGLYGYTGFASYEGWSWLSNASYFRILSISNTSVSIEQPDRSPTMIILPQELAHFFNTHPCGVSGCTYGLDDYVNGIAPTISQASWYQCVGTSPSSSCADEFNYPVQGNITVAIVQLIGSTAS